MEIDDLCYSMYHPLHIDRNQLGIYSSNLPFLLLSTWYQSLVWQKVIDLKLVTEIELTSSITKNVCVM